MLRETVKGSVWMSASWFIVKLLSVVYMAFLARQLGPTGLGTFSIALLLTPWFIMFSSLSLQTVGTHFVSQFRAAKKDMGSLIKSIFLLTFGLGGIATVLHFLAAPFAATYFFHDASLTPYLQLGSFVILLSVVYYGYIGIVRGFKRFYLYATLDVLKEVFLVGLGFLLVGYFGMSVMGALLAVLGSHVVLLFFRPAPGVNWITKKHAPLKPLMVSSLWFTSIGLLLSFFTTLDRFLLGFLQSKAALGLYVSALGIVNMGMFFASSVKNAMLPVLSEHLTKKKKLTDPVFAHYIHKLLSYGMIVAGLFIMFVITYRVEILSLIFGSDYLAAAPYLAIMIFALLFMTLYLLAHTLMISLDRMHQASVMCIVVLLLSTILFYVMIRTFGVVGAAYGLVFSYVLLDIGYYFFVFRDLTFRKGSLGFLLFLTLAAASCTFFLPMAFVQRTFFFAVLTGGYLALLFVLNYVGFREFQVLLTKLLRR
ncbi:MAG TPA: oligosaccharide flippase family protein [Candidatus Nanoarchaeia archaeon]|nr:oligosaccharide flippase family protein [Candidatus Nanoarchaeia archaeon]